MRAWMERQMLLHPLRIVMVIWAVVLAVVLVTVLSGCGMFRVHHKAQVGDHISDLLEEHGLPMREYYYNPLARASYYTVAELSRPGFTGWLWYHTSNIRCGGYYVVANRVREVVVRPHSWGLYFEYSERAYKDMQWR